MKILNWLFGWTKSLQDKCGDCNTNPGDIFGICEECLTKRIREDDALEAEREHNKLKCAVKEALKEIEEERKS